MEIHENRSDFLIDFGIDFSGFFEQVLVDLRLDAIMQDNGTIVKTQQFFAIFLRFG